MSENTDVACALCTKDSIYKLKPAQHVVWYAGNKEFLPSELYIEHIGAKSTFMLNDNAGRSFAFIIRYCPLCGRRVIP